MVNSDDGRDHIVHQTVACIQEKRNVVHGATVVLGSDGHVFRGVDD